MGVAGLLILSKQHMVRDELNSGNLGINGATSIGGTRDPVVRRFCFVFACFYSACFLDYLPYRALLRGGLKP
jgi:hypothetical protein